MKNKIFLFILLNTLLLILCSCTKPLKSVDLTEEVVTKEYTDLEGNELEINSIYIDNGIGIKGVNVSVHYAKEKKVVVSAPEDFFEDFKATSKSNEIKLQASHTKKYNTRDIKIDIYGYVFNEVDLSNVDATFENSTLNQDFSLNVEAASSVVIRELNSSEADIDVSGASQVTFNMITASKFDYEVSGASKLVVFTGSIGEAEGEVSGASEVLFGGSCQEFNLELSGASKLECNDCSCVKANLKISGASYARIKVTENLIYSISGASSFYYNKSVKNVDEKSRSGSCYVEATE